MSWKSILKEDVEEEILDEVEAKGGALGMKNLKDIADKKKLKETISDMKEDGKLFEHKHGDYYTHEPVKKWEEVLKIRGLFSNKPKPPQFTVDGIKFSDQNDLNTYNQNKSALKSAGRFLTEYLKNEGDVFVGRVTIQQGIKYAQQKAKEEYNKQQQEMRQFRTKPRMTSSNITYNTGGTHTPSGTRWRG